MVGPSPLWFDWSITLAARTAYWMACPSRKVSTKPPVMYSQTFTVGDASTINFHMTWWTCMYDIEKEGPHHVLFVELAPLTQQVNLLTLAAQLSSTVRNICWLRIGNVTISLRIHSKWSEKWWYAVFRSVNSYILCKSVNVSQFDQAVIFAVRHFATPETERLLGLAHHKPPRWGRHLPHQAGWLQSAARLHGPDLQCLFDTT